MKKTIVTLLAASTLATAFVPVFATESAWVDPNATEATVTYHNEQLAKQAAEEAAAKAAKEEAALKAGVTASTYVGEESAPKADVYTLETKLADGSKSVTEVPFVNNKATLPDGTVVERPAAAAAATAEETKAEETKTATTTAAATTAKTAAATSTEKKAHNSVAAAKTATAQKALPKTSAVK